MLEVYLKLKCKRPDGFGVPIATFSFKKRVKKCTGLAIFFLWKYDDILREFIFATKV